MNRAIVILNIVMLCGVAALAQSHLDAAQQEAINQKFRAFDYDAVIELADQALLHAADYPAEILFPIYEMKAVSHFSKMDMTQALSSFVEILKIDPEHELDPVKYSPKIIAFYNEVKANFISPVDISSSSQPREAASPDTVVVYRADNSFKKLIYPSLLAPGTGQWLNGKRKKGMIVTGASTALLLSSLYFTYDCSQKEKDYLNVVGQNDIDAKYKKYNYSYKTRNALWTAYTLIWAYSQIDLYLSHKSSIQLGLLPPDVQNSSVGFALIARF